MNDIKQGQTSASPTSEKQQPVIYGEGRGGERNTNTITYSKAMAAFKEKYIPVNEGKTFTIEDVLRFFGCMNDKKEARQAYYRVLYELSTVNKKQLLERKNKNYRIINSSLKVIDWHQDINKGTIAIEWPYSPQDNRSFGFDDDIVLYEGDMILIAGEGNRGKTAWVLNMMINNCDKMPVYYFTSEFNAPKFRDRMKEFKWRSFLKEDGSPKFTVADQVDNWQDVIQPDALNIIDWMKLDDEMWKIRGIMDGIKNKLKKGLAVICIQKRTYKKYGEGGEYSKDLASVYLTMSYDDKMKVNTLYVDKVKTPGLVDPNFSKWSFNIYKGAEFANIKKVVKSES